MKNREVLICSSTILLLVTCLLCVLCDSVVSTCSIVQNTMPYHGFVRVAAGSPLLRVADCHANAERTVALMQDAEAKGVEILVFPEMGLTGYTCNDLYFQQTLQRGAVESLQSVASATASDYSGVAVVGLPLVVDDQIFNVAAILQSGQVLGSSRNPICRRIRNFTMRGSLHRLRHLIAEVLNYSEKKFRLEPICYSPQAMSME